MRKIIVLNNVVNKDGSNTLKNVFWLAVPLKVRKADAAATSQVLDVTAPELASLRDGSIVEKFVSITVNNLLDARVILPRMYAEDQKELNDQGTKTDYAGVYWDGTKWNNP